MLASLLPCAHHMHYTRAFIEEWGPQGRRTYIFMRLVHDTFYIPDLAQESLALVTYLHLLFHKGKRELVPLRPYPRYFFP